MKRNIVFLFGFLLLTGSCSYRTKLTAEYIKLPPYYSSGMIIQTSPQTIIQGWATPKSRLAVRIDNYVEMTKTDHEGKWQVKFPELLLDKPFSMVIEGKDTSIHFNNIHAGKLYILIGNADLNPLEAHDKQACKDLDRDNNTLVRVFRPNVQANAGSNLNLQGKWYPSEEGLRLLNSCDMLDVVYASHTNNNLAIGIFDLTLPGAQLACWDTSYTLQSSAKPALIKEMALPLNTELTDSVIFLRDSSQQADNSRLALTWFNDAAWPEYNLPVKFSEVSEPNQRIIYLRKKLYIPPRYVNSDFTIELGLIKGKVDCYFNQEKIFPKKTDSGINLHIPDSLIQNYTNLLFIRTFKADELSGMYGPAVLCYNEDSSYYRDISDSWKVNAALEPEFKPFSVEVSLPGWLYANYQQILTTMPSEEVLWYGNTYELYQDGKKLQLIKSVFENADNIREKAVLIPEFSSLDTLLFPNIEQGIDSLFYPIKNSGITIYSAE